MLVVFPPDGDALFYSRELGLAAVAVYTLLAGLTAERSARPWFARMREWLGQRPPTPEEARAVLRIPARFARMSLLRWGLGDPAVRAADAHGLARVRAEEATAVALAGLSATAAVYLAVEWLMRPAFALRARPRGAARGALAGHRPALPAHLAAVLRRPDPDARADPRRPRRARSRRAGRADLVRRRDGADHRLRGHQARHAGGDPPDPAPAPGGRRGRRRQPRRRRRGRRRQRDRPAAGGLQRDGRRAARARAPARPLRPPGRPRRRARGAGAAAGSWAASGARSRRCSST